MNKVRLLACMLPAILSMSSTFVVTTAVAVATSSVAYAADKKPKQPTVRKEIGKPLQEAQELVKAKKFKDANAKYKEAMAVADKTPFETSMLNEFGAYLALQSKDYASAAKIYESTLQSELPADQKAQRIKLVAQLYYALKNYPKATQYGNQYLTEVGPNKDISTLVLQSAYLQNDYKKTISILNKMIADDQKAGKKPSEDNLQMLMSCYYKLKQTPDVEKTLQVLVANYPKAEYWQNIFTYLDATRGGTDRTEFEAYRLKQSVGGLDPDEYVAMAELAMAVGVPGDARSVLKQGVSSGFVGKGANKSREDRLMALANSQSATDEAELASQDKQAAAGAKGDLDAKIGEAYMSYGNYNKAIEVIQRAQKKGGISTPDLAQLHLGVAQLKAGKKADAIKSFKAVPASSKLNKLATLWAIHAAAK